MSKAIRINENNPNNGKPMQNIETRLTRVEDGVQQIRVDIARINTRLDTELPHLATKADLAELRTELKGDITGLRAELKGDITGLRAELKGDIAGLRTELKDDIAGLRTELRTGDADIRTELRTEIANVRTEIVKSRNTIIVWTVGLLIASGIINSYLPILIHNHSAPAPITTNK